MHRPFLSSSTRKPVCSGTGLVALDIVYNDNTQREPRVWAGGSCGNVLTILAFLGWNSYPVARLHDDVFAHELIEDLLQWNVDTSLIYRESAGSTPIIIERITIDRNNAPKHKFEFTCPNCRSWLPRFRPIPARDVERIAEAMPQSSVFYLDRATPGTLELAKRNKEQGAVIVFEPSSIDNQRLFAQCLQISDILKYSHDRLGQCDELAEGAGVTLQIETLGSRGLRYRRARNNTSSNWKLIEPFVVTELRDAAGSGDWCTAGLIHYLSIAGGDDLDDAPDEEIDDALRFGQALAALNCLYDGARGSMYNLSRKVFNNLIEQILSGDYPDTTALTTTFSESSSYPEERICPSCSFVNS